jgi:hypothetical protein
MKTTKTISEDSRTLGGDLNSGTSRIRSRSANHSDANFVHTYENERREQAEGEDEKSKEKADEK